METDLCKYIGRKKMCIMLVFRAVVDTILNMYYYAINAQHLNPTYTYILQKHAIKHAYMSVFYSRWYCCAMHISYCSCFKYTRCSHVFYKNFNPVNWNVNSNKTQEVTASITLYTLWGYENRINILIHSRWREPNSCYMNFLYTFIIKLEIRSNILHSIEKCLFATSRSE